MSYSEIYKNAFAELKKYYPAAFFTCAVGVLLTSGLHQLKEFIYRAVTAAAGHNIGLLLMILLVYLAASIGVYFWSDVIFAGEAKFFMQAKSGEINTRNLFWFLNGRENAVKVLWRKYIHIFLATLMLVIPGVIAEYDLILVPYMMCEDPDMPKDRAFEISENAMEGYKWKCFVMLLQFYAITVLELIIAFLLRENMIVVYVVLYIISTIAQPIQLAVMQEFYEFMKGRIFAAAIDINEEEGKTEYTVTEEVIEVYSSGNDDEHNDRILSVTSDDLTEKIM